VTILSTVSRAHLRRAGPDGPGREQRGRARAAERERAARVTRRKRPGFTQGSRRCRAAAFAASFGRKPYGAAVAAHSIPGDRPPAVPAVSRCRARQHHDQAITRTPSAPIAVKMSQPPSRNAAHCPGRPLQRQGHPPLSAGDLCRPSGPDGEGQARGQARNARGEPSQSVIHRD